MQITGQQIILRDQKLKDIEVVAYWRQVGHRWQELDGPYYPHEPPTPEDIEKFRQRLEKTIEENAWPEPRRQFVIASRETDELLGTVTRYWISEETNWPAIGIAIYDPQYWKRGIGYEALGLWADYLFNCGLEFARLDLRTWSGNSGMMKLAEKLGFIQEACFRKARIVKGEFYDGLGYGILREEWDDLYPNGFPDQFK